MNRFPAFVRRVGHRPWSAPAWSGNLRPRPQPRARVTVGRDLRVFLLEPVRTTD